MQYTSWADMLGRKVRDKVMDKPGQRYRGRIQTVRHGTVTVRWDGGGIATYTNNPTDPTLLNMADLELI